jgi:hypothetical protein
MLPNKWKSKDTKTQLLGTVWVIVKTRIDMHMQALDMEKEDGTIHMVFIDETQFRTNKYHTTLSHY